MKLRKEKYIVVTEKNNISRSNLPTKPTIPTDRLQRHSVFQTTLLHQLV